VPLTGATDGPADTAKDAPGDPDPVFEQAARMTAPARIPATAGRIRAG
jgi:hypothetical protein